MRYFPVKKEKIWFRTLINLFYNKPYENPLFHVTMRNLGPTTKLTIFL